MLLAGSRLAAQQAAYDLDDWMSVSSVTSFVWAPDGEGLFYTSNAAENGTWEIFRISPDGGGPTQISSAPIDGRAEPKGDLAVSADGERLIFTAASLFQSYLNIFTMPAAGGEATRVTFNDAMIHGGPSLAPDGRTLTYFARTGASTRIFIEDLDAPTSWPRLLLPESNDERSPLWSPDGARLLFQRGGDIWITDREGTTPRRVIEPAHQGGNGSPVWSPDGTRIAFTTGKSGFGQIGVADVATGRVTAITREPRDHGSPSWSPDGRTLVFVRADDGMMANHVVAAPSDGSGPHRTLTEGTALRDAPQFAPDGGSVAYLEEATNRTSDIWRVPAGGGEATQVTRSMGRVDPARLSVGEEVRYPGVGDLPIPTMLLRPWGFEEGVSYPVIVRLHGHPGQWNHSFDAMDQFFLERGFVVIKPNPRGSRGFGAGFHDLHVADYGGAEFGDVMAVLPYLEGLGYVDTTRKATWGGSGGGYMSFVIATEAPDAFEAQVIRAPVSDWKLLAIDRFGASGRAWTATRTPRRERSEFGGSEAEIPEEYHRRSPINFAEASTVPQLLLHGLRDSAVLPRQSQVWAERMEDLGREDFIYVEYPDEDHSLRRYKATVRDRLERMVDFFSEHLRLPELANR